MHVVERGTGTPVVMLHGFGVDHRMLLPLDPVMEASSGWRRLYVDLPGTAGTPIGQVSSTTDVVSLVRDLVVERIGSEPFAVVGNSWGGLIARQIAHEFRAQLLGLALVAPLMVADADRRDVDEPVLIRADEPTVAAWGEMGEAYRTYAVVQSPENMESFAAHIWPGIQGVDAMGQERIRSAYALAADPEDASPEPLVVPALFILGRQDGVVGYRDALSRLDHYPRATFATLDEAGHNVVNDQLTLSTALMANWLERIRAYSG